MAKLLDKFFNRTIEGKLELSNEEKNEIVDVIVDNDALAGEVVKVGKLIENGDTELIDLGQYVNPNFAKSHTLYCKALVKHGILNIVVSGKFVAGSSAGANPTILNNFYDAIKSVAHKIIRSDGTAIDEDKTSNTPTANQYIACSQVIKEVGTFGSSSFALLKSPLKNELVLAGFSFGTISEDTEGWMDFRVTLTL